MSTGGLGGLNKSPNGVVFGVVQLQLPNVVTPTDLAVQTQCIVDLVAKARRNLPTMDLVVFPEYSLHGLSMDTNPAIMCSLDGPEMAAFRKACVDNSIWGCFSIMELNPGGIKQLGLNRVFGINSVEPIATFYQCTTPVE